MAESLGAIQMQVRAKFGPIRKGLANMQAGLRKADQSTKKARRGSDEMVKSLARLSTSMIAVTGSAGLMTRGVIGSVKAFSQFERTMTRVAAVTNSLDKEAFGAMKASALELSKTTEFTAQQVAEGMAFMGQAGFSAAQTMQAMPAVLSLSSAAMLDLGRSSDIATNILTSFGRGTRQLGADVNTLVATFTNANVNVQQIGKAFEFVGALASSVGVDFIELNAAIGLLGNVGIQGEKAGTGLRGAIARLIAPTRQAREIIDQLGLTVFDGTGQFVGFTSVLRQLKQAGATSGQVMKLFGQRAGQTMIVLARKGAKGMEEMKDTIIKTGNAAEKVAEAQLNTLSGQFKIMKSAVTAAGIAFGEGLAPALRLATQAIGGIAIAFENLFRTLSLRTDLTATRSEFDEQAETVKRFSTVLDRLKKKRAEVQAAMKKGIAGPEAEKKIAILNKNIGEIVEKMKKINAEVAGAGGEMENLAGDTGDFESKSKKAASAWSSIKKSIESMLKSLRDKAFKAFLEQEFGKMPALVDVQLLIKERGETVSELRKPVRVLIKSIQRLRDTIKQIKTLPATEANQARIDITKGRIENVKKLLRKEIKERENNIVKSRGAFEKLAIAQLQAAESAKEFERALLTAEIAGLIRPSQVDKIFASVDPAKFKNFDFAAESAGEMDFQMKALSGKLQGFRDAVANGSKISRENAADAKKFNAILTATAQDILNKFIPGLDDGTDPTEIKNIIRKNFDQGFTAANIGRTIGDILGKSRMAEDVSKAMSRVFHGATIGTMNLPGVKSLLGPGVIKDFLSRIVGGGAATIASVLGPIGAAIGAGIGPLIDGIVKGAESIITGIGNTLISTAETLSGTVKAIIPDERVSSAIEDATRPFLDMMSSVTSGMAKLVGGFLLLAGPVTIIGTMVFPILALAAIKLTPAFLSLGLAAIVAAPAFIALAAIVAALTANMMLFLGFLSLSTKTEAFERFQSAMGAVVDKIILALEPFATQFLALAGLFDAFVAVLLPMVNAFAGSEVFMRTVFEGFKLIAIVVAALLISLAALNFAFLALVDVIASSAANMASAFEGIGDAIMKTFGEVAIALGEWVNSFAAGMGDSIAKAGGVLINNAEQTGSAGTAAESLRAMADEARSLQPNLGEMATAFQELVGLSFDEALIRGENLAAIKESSEQLLNIPVGFKVARERFRAIIPGLGVNEPVQTGGDRGGTVINIENMGIAANNPDDFVAQLVEAAATRNFQQAGSFFESIFNTGN